MEAEWEGKTGGVYLEEEDIAWGPITAKELIKGRPRGVIKSRETIHIPPMSTSRYFTPNESLQSAKNEDFLNKLTEIVDSSSSYFTANEEPNNENSTNLIKTRTVQSDKDNFEATVTPKESLMDAEVEKLSLKYNNLRLSSRHSEKRSDEVCLVSDISSNENTLLNIIKKAGPDVENLSVIRECLVDLSGEEAINVYENDQNKNKTTSEDENKIIDLTVDDENSFLITEEEEDQQENKVFDDDDFNEEIFEEKEKHIGCNVSNLQDSQSSSNVHNEIVVIEDDFEASCELEDISCNENITQSDLSGEDEQDEVILITDDESYEEDEHYDRQMIKEERISLNTVEEVKSIENQNEEHEESINRSVIDYEDYKEEEEIHISQNYTAPEIPNKSISLLKEKENINEYKDNTLNEREKTHHFGNSYNQLNSSKYSNISDCSEHLDDEQKEASNIQFNDTLEEMEMLLKEGVNYEMPEKSFVNEEAQSVSRSQMQIVTGSFSNFPHQELEEPKSTKSTHNTNNKQTHIPKLTPRKDVFKVPTAIPSSSSSKKIPQKSPFGLKKIVSPVGVYIKNSTFPLKQNLQPKIVTKLFSPTRNNKTLNEKENRFATPSTIPSGVIYKPAKTTIAEDFSPLNLPKSIKKMVSVPIVSKHQKRITPKTDKKDITKELIDDKDLTGNIDNSNFDISVLVNKEAFIDH